MVFCVTLLNKKYTITEFPSSPELEWLNKQLNGGSIEGLYISENMEIYVDESGLYKDLNQNVSLAYLMNEINGFLGLLYGLGIIICKGVKATQRIKEWLQRLDEDRLEDETRVAIVQKGNKYHLTSSTINFQRVGIETVYNTLKEAEDFLVECDIGYFIIAKE